MPPVFDLLYLFALIIFNCFLFTALNIEYYEEIAEKVSVRNEKIKQLRNNKVDVKAEMEKEIKKVNLNSNSKERWGVLSLYWKASRLLEKENKLQLKIFIVFTQYYNWSFRCLSNTKRRATIINNWNKHSNSLCLPCFL